MNAFYFCFLILLCASAVHAQAPPKDGQDYCCTKRPGCDDPCREDCAAEAQTCELMTDRCSSFGPYVPCRKVDGVDHGNTPSHCCLQETPNFRSPGGIGQCLNFPDSPVLPCSAHAIRRPFFDPQKKKCCSYQNARRRLQEEETNDRELQAGGTCDGSCDHTCDTGGYPKYECINLDQHCHGSESSFGFAELLPCGDRCCLDGQPVDGIWGGNTLEEFCNDFLYEADVPTLCPAKRGGSAFGDPHFSTWTGQFYDYHGECDLVFLHAPYLDLDIHVRTTARYEYSFIETVAVRLGEDVLEVGSWGQYFWNGVESSAELGERVNRTQTDRKHGRFEIHLGEEGGRIVVSTFKDLVRVQVEDATAASFGSSVGLLGDYHSGDLLGRDGRQLDDPNAFGQEWQVRSDEPKLFQNSDRAPQHPQEVCRLPGAGTSTRRRLGQGIARAAAEKACARWKGAFERCVYDVLATGDLEIAQVGAF